MPPPTLLFDLDGTLTNPVSGFIASIHYALKSLDLPIPDDSELTPFIGPPLRDTMGKLLKTDDRELIEKAVELYRWRLDNGGKFDAEIIDGIPEVLGRLTTTDYSLYVCTGKPEGLAKEIVNHFDLSKYFNGIYGAQLDGRHCDKADLIGHILEFEKIESPVGIMIGDTVIDISGGKAHGFGTVAVRWGFGREEDLRSAGADVFVDTAMELIPAIESLVNR